MKKGIPSKWIQEETWYSHFNMWQNRLQSKPDQKRQAKALHNFQRENKQTNISILNIYVSNTRTTRFIKETWLQFKLHIDPHAGIVGDFNTLHSTIGRSYRQCLHREMLEINDFINQMK